MLNFNRSARPSDAKPADKTTLKPAVSSAAYPLAQGNATSRQQAASAPPAGTKAIPTPSATTQPTPAQAPQSLAAAVVAPVPAAPPPAPVAANAAVVARTDRANPPTVAETPGSKLTVGPNIKLKGVEISDCDVLVVEGHVEATVHSRAMQVAEPGTLRGLAVIDVAEIDGTFTGELTATVKLVVNGTGRVSGTIRYGRLIVAEGGELSGDVKCIDAQEEPEVRPRLSDTRPFLSPEDDRRP